MARRQQAVCERQCSKCTHAWKQDRHGGYRRPAAPQRRPLQISGARGRLRHQAGGAGTAAPPRLSVRARSRTRPGRACTAHGPARGGVPGKQGARAVSPYARHQTNVRLWALKTSRRAARPHAPLPLPAQSPDGKRGGGELEGGRGARKRHNERGAEHDGVLRLLAGVNTPRVALCVSAVARTKCK